MAQDRPNIVLMLADDQGWSGTSVPMHPEMAGSKGEYLHTPNLERLAAEGMRFSAGYAPASVCSPTRISLQTGRSPAALHWTKAARAAEGYPLIEPQNIRSLAAKEVTIAELLRDAGYATAHYGKWHLGGGGPERHGYDESDGDTGNEHAFRFEDPNPVDIFGMADRAAGFMERNARAGKPFFIQLSWNALHAPGNANRTTLARYRKLLPEGNQKRVETAAITEDLDSGVGRVLDAIAQLGLADTTFVIYLSDNGAGGGSGGGRTGLNGGKGGVWEGGIRVPFIVRGPGVAAGSWCHTRVVGYDLFPTFCDWAGISGQQRPRGIEGGSIVDVLANEGKGEIKRRCEELVFHFPHYQGDTPHSAILWGDYKLIHFYEDHRDLLFNLTRDPGERNDLARSMPDETARLRERLETHLKAIGAQFPTVNPEFDRNQTNPERRGRGGGKGRTGGGEQQRGKQPKGENRWAD